MADLTARDAKLVQYLNEAYGKEKELETALEAHIAMTTRDNYRKRLRDHLRETKAHARGLERRIKQIGGKASVVPVPDAAAGVAEAAQSGLNKAVAAAKGPLHMIRGTSEQEKMLKNAKTEFFNEAEEIATYSAIVVLAEELGDRETAKLAKGILREEERMQKFLERLIPQLTKAVVREEVPARERSNGRKPARRRSSSSRSSSNGSRASSSRKSSSRGRTSAKSSSRKSASSRSGSSSRGSSSGRAKSSSGRAKSSSSGGRSSGGAKRSSARGRAAAKR